MLLCWFPKHIQDQSNAGPSEVRGFVTMLAPVQCIHVFYVAEVKLAPGLTLRKQSARNTELH